MSPVISRSISTDLGLNCLLGFLTDHVWGSLAAVTAAALTWDGRVIVACSQTLIVSQGGRTTDSCVTVESSRLPEAAANVASAALSQRFQV